MEYRDIILTSAGVYAKDGSGRLCDVSTDDKIMKLVKRHRLSSTEVGDLYNSGVRDQLLVDESLGRFRVSIMNTVDGLGVSLRCIAKSVQSLSELGMPEHIEKSLLKYDSGLVLISGKMASGKTTSASAYASTYLEMFGGTCVTLEDPPEVYLNGMHGKGLCEQCEVPYQDFAKEMVHVLRHGAPEVIFLGELREELAATEAVRAASNGHLVIATVHGGNLVETVARVNSLVSSEHGRQQFAGALSAIVNQRLSLTGQGMVLSVSALFVGGAGNEDAIRNVLREGQLHRLQNEIDQQQREQAKGL